MTEGIEPMKNRIARLALVGGLALVAAAPAAPAHAFVCDPSVRDLCDAVCSRATTVCRLFG
jgi:hypothetical protein